MALGLGDFELTPVHPSPNVSVTDDYKWVFQIAIKSKPSLCLDLSSGSTTNGNTLEIWECNSLENQLWFFTGGTYEIQYAGNSQKCLDAGSGMKQGNQVMIWDCNKQPQQRWGYDPKGNTIYLDSSASGQDASMCLDLSGGSTTLGTPVQVWGCSGDWMQQWGLQPGINIRIGQNTKLCFDLAGGSTDDGTAIQIWGCNGLDQQFWIFESGTNMIRSAKDMTK